MPQSAGQHAESPSALPEHMHDRPPPANARRGSWFVLASAEGRVIGFAWAVAFAGSTTAAFIEEVVVAADRRGEGIGSQLLREVARHMLRVGREELSILPIGSNGWVRRAGFQELGDGRTSTADARAVLSSEQDGPSGRVG